MDKDEAEAIARLAALETLREQARAGNRSAMVENVEKLIEAELRAIKRIRGHSDQEGTHPKP
ncbi:hypothetical protein [Ramlibacter sp. PS4R-6]|uniref:hypothetical protein n=1 Tax=Ramlibacter sp. PS4R-6 TaxID=3133438 RepID=UPI0030A9E6BD